MNSDKKHVLSLDKISGSNQETKRVRAGDEFLAALDDFVEIYATRYEIP
jgi:hypothetical protein